MPLFWTALQQLLARIKKKTKNKKTAQNVGRLHGAGLQQQQQQGAFFLAFTSLFGDAQVPFGK